MRISFLWVLGFAIVCGCSYDQKKALWQPPPFAKPQSKAHSAKPMASAAEALYAEASWWESQHSEACVDLYYEATKQAWNEAQLGDPNTDPELRRPWHLYHSSLAKLLTTADQYNRFDGRGGLLVTTDDGSNYVPIVYHDFYWSPDDFRNFVIVGRYPKQSLLNVYQSCGLGVPVMAQARDAPPPFVRAKQEFAATALLQPATGEINPDGSARFQLEFYNPLTNPTLVADGVPAPASRDITAPIAFVSQERSGKWLTDFILPSNEADTSGLTMIEPYQPGKIPVLFVHGLLSDPTTWADLGNDLRSHQNIVEQFQLWTFSYDTGEPFMAAAARLRQDLRNLRNTVDPEHCDPALDNILLIGHSMGGLVAKLQVTYSSDILWSSIANRPLDAIVAPPQVKARLHDSFFFNPSPDISRVIYIGTPHRGSTLARRWIGRLGSSLVEEPREERTQYRQLVQANPGVLSPELRRRIPTSIDLLEPDNPLLNAMLYLPSRPGVIFHSIIGEGYWMPGQGSSDTVVPVSSAILANTSSDFFLHAKHTDLNRNPATVGEVLRIMKEHYRQYKLSTEECTIELPIE